MGRKKVTDIRRVGDDEEVCSRIIVNGHSMSNTQYLNNPEEWNKLPFREGYLEECGIDPSTVKPELLPGFIQEAS